MDEERRGPAAAPTELAGDCVPPVRDGPSARHFVEWCTRLLGAGFHPDTRFAEYVGNDGRPAFTPATAWRLDVTLGRACELVPDPYAVAGGVQRALLEVEPDPVAGRVWVIVGLEGPGGLCETGVHPTVFRSRVKAEAEIQDMMRDMAEDEADRAKLLRWLTVAEAYIDGEKTDDEADATGR